MSAERHVRGVRACLAAAALGVAGLGAAWPGSALAQPPKTPVVIIDAGHGGDDFGAVGPGGTLEKDVALKLSNEVGGALEKAGIVVVYTRKTDRFVSLAERTQAANGAHGDLYLSVHANASRDTSARGFETYFLAVEASDQDALQVAITENQVFKQAPDPRAADIVGAILGDMAVADTLRMSRMFAIALSRELAKLPGENRGVKQANFAVLSGVNMPSALLETGFLTNAEDEKLLLTSRRQKEIATAVVRSLTPLLREAQLQRTLRPKPLATPVTNGPDHSAQSDAPTADGATQIPTGDVEPSRPALEPSREPEPELEAERTLTPAPGAELPSGDELGGQVQP